MPSWFRRKWGRPIWRQSDAVVVAAARGTQQGRWRWWWWWWSVLNWNSIFSKREEEEEEVEAILHVPILLLLVRCTIYRLIYLSAVRIDLFSLSPNPRGGQFNLMTSNLPILGSIGPSLCCALPRICSKPTTPPQSAAAAVSFWGKANVRVEAKKWWLQTFHNGDFDYVSFSFC